MERRTFIQHSCMAVAGAPLFWQLMKQHQQVEDIGIQLYTLRDDMKNDAAGTLKKLAQIGYKQIEAAGYYEGTFYGMAPKAFKEVLDGEGLGVLSGHTQTGRHQPEQKGTMINDWEAAVADAATIGQKYIVLAYIHDFERQKIDNYKQLAELCNKCGEVCKKYGIQLAYHNHDFEFLPLDEQIPYDVLLKETDVELMKMELDLYWIRKAGKDALSYFKQHSGRFPLWHVKDMDATDEQYFTEVGNGVIDWPKLFQAAETAGMKHFYVEQDHCRNHQPLKSVEISYNYLNKMKY